MKHFRLISVLATSTLLATFSAYAQDKAATTTKQPAQTQQQAEPAHEEHHQHHHHKKHHKAPLHRYTLTGGATYLAPAMNGIDYVTTETVSGGIESYSSENINPNYNWGYFLAFGYMISSHYDIQASWQQFNSNQSESETFAGPGNIYSSSPHFQHISAGEVDEASTEETLNTQSFDATLGQYHKITQMLTARPFAGVKYAQVNSNTENAYTGAGIRTVFPLSETYDSKYNGVGPEIGVDAEYKIVQHFGMTAHFATALLVGDLQTDTDVVSNGSLPFSDDFDGEKNNHVVPSLDAKLGLNWNSLYAHDSFGIGIEGGYQVAYYFDVVDQVQVQTAGPKHNYSDVGIMGPYMNLSARF